MVKKRAKIPETEPYPRKPTICSASNAQDSIFPTTHLQKLCSGVAAIDNRRELQHSSCHGRAKKSSHGSYNTATRNYKRPTKRRSLMLIFFSTESLALPLVKQRHSSYMNMRGEDMGRWTAHQAMYGRWSSCGKCVGDRQHFGGWGSHIPTLHTFYFLFYF